VNKKQRKLLVLGAMARQLGVEPRWLRIEAETGRLPHVKAGRTLLFNPNVAEQLLIERASKGDKNVR
jgi:hypothetical protein